MKAIQTRAGLDDTIAQAVMTLILVLALFLSLYPLYFILIASISDPTQVNLGRVVLLPKQISLDGYVKILQNREIWIGYRNTIFYTTAGTLLNLAVTLTAAYALSRKDLAGCSAIMLLMTFTMFFSGGLIPRYFLVRSLKLLDTYWIMIIGGTVNVSNVIISRTFFRTTIPDEMLESAKLDGCGDFRFFLRIVLPLSMAIVAVMALYYAVGHWNSYFSALIYLQDRNKYPLQLIMREILLGAQLTADMMRDDEAAYRAMQLSEQMKYTLIIVASVPILTLYPFLQKYFMKGVMIGAIKG